jgi:hypothetical protein
MTSERVLNAADKESVSPAELEKLALTEALFRSRYAASHEPVL